MKKEIHPKNPKKNKEICKAVVKTDKPTNFTNFCKEKRWRLSIYIH